MRLRTVLSSNTQPWFGSTKAVSVPNLSLTALLGFSTWFWKCFSYLLELTWCLFAQQLVNATKSSNCVHLVTVAAISSVCHIAASCVSSKRTQKRSFDEELKRYWRWYRFEVNKHAHQVVQETWSGSSRVYEWREKHYLEPSLTFSHVFPWNLFSQRALVS